MCPRVLSPPLVLSASGDTEVAPVLDLLQVGQLVRVGLEFRLPDSVGETSLETRARKRGGDVPHLPSSQLLLRWVTCTRFAAVGSTLGWILGLQGLSERQPCRVTGLWGGQRQHEYWGGVCSHVGVSDKGEAGPFTGSTASRGMETLLEWEALHSTGRLSGGNQDSTCPQPLLRLSCLVVGSLPGKTGSEATVSLCSFFLLSEL